MLSFYLSLVSDEAAKSKIEQLYIQYRHTMLWVAMTVLNDHHLAEDAVHDAFIRIFSNIEKYFFEDCNKTRSFVVIIVRNIANDYLKKKRRMAEVCLDDFQEYLEEPRPDPEETLLDKEGHQKILEALGELHQSYADVIALHVFFELDAKEIATLLNITYESVRVQLHRGRKKLLEILKGDD